MRYGEDKGAPDMNGRYIQEGDFLAVATNNGIRIGKVLAVKTNEYSDWQGNVYGYTYSISMQKYHGSTKRQTFQHDTMGEEKFWVVELDSKGEPVLE